MIKVIGIDPSMTATGLCAWDGTVSTVKTVAKQRDNRLRVIREAVAAVAVVRPPNRPTLRVPEIADLAVVEEPIHFRAKATTAALWMVQAAVRMALMDAGVPYAIVNNQHVKAYAGGGRSDKEAMARAAYETDGSVFADDNQCDAWWLRQMALDRYGLLPLGSRRVSATQRAWLDKVEWPDLDTGAQL
jgi:Holliday junction resolvasome RuvABC endonuclease subunit